MLLVPLYHRVDQRIQSHLAYFAQYPTLFPGDSLNVGINTCLTFDDATHDFYEDVFPLLQRYSLKALLAVPVSFIGKKGFCSWTELREMHESGFVTIASHSMNHPDMTRQTINLQEEIEESKDVLEKTLNTKITTFVYPFGKFNRIVHSRVKNHYSFIMRIGTAYNHTWKSPSGLIYRIPVNNLDASPETLFRRKHSLAYWMNLLRGR